MSVYNTPCTFLDVKHTVMRFHPLELHLPAQVLSIDLAHISDEECILLSGFTGISVDAFHSLFQNILGQDPASVRSITNVLIAICTERRFFLSQFFVLLIVRWFIVVSNIYGRWCHRQADSRMEKFVLVH